MNDKNVYDAISAANGEDPRVKVLNFIFAHPIEKIYNSELRTVAITTRQSMEILCSMLEQVGQEHQTFEQDPLNNQSA